MRLLCLDLSTNTGWALMLNGVPLEYGNIRSKVKGDSESPDYPMNFIAAARQVALEVHRLITSARPDCIVVEETNKGKNRYSQKQLEFIHYAVNIVIDAHPSKPKLAYLDTSEWRMLLGITLDKEQRKSNRGINTERSDARRSYEDMYFKSHQQAYHLANAWPKKMERNRAMKEFNAARDVWVKEQMKSFRVKRDGKVVGKVSTKHLSVAYVNSTLNTKFKHKDNDIADAMCLGVAFEKKAASSVPPAVS